MVFDDSAGLGRGSPHKLKRSQSKSEAVKQVFEKLFRKQLTRKDTSKQISTATDDSGSKIKNIFSKFCKKKLKKFLDKGVQVKAKDYLELLKYRPSESHLSILEAAIKQRRVANKELFKTIQAAEALQRNLEIRVMKGQNDRTRQGSASLVSETLKEVHRLFTLTLSDNFFFELKSKLVSSQTELPSANELRQDKARAKQKRLVQNLIEENRNRSKLREQLSECLDGITRRAKQAEKNERHLSKRALDKGFNKKKGSSASLKQALRRFAQNRLNREGRGGSQARTRTSGGERGHGDSARTESTMAKPPAWVSGGKRISVFGRFPHFNGATRNERGKFSFPIFRLGRPNQRKSDQLAADLVLGQKAFKTINSSRASDPSSMRRPLSQTSIEQMGMGNTGETLAMEGSQIMPSEIESRIREFIRGGMKRKKKGAKGKGDKTGKKTKKGGKGKTKGNKKDAKRQGSVRRTKSTRKSRRKGKPRSELKNEKVDVSKVGKKVDTHNKTKLKRNRLEIRFPGKDNIELSGKRKAKKAKPAKARVNKRHRKKQKTGSKARKSDKDSVNLYSPSKLKSRRKSKTAKRLYKSKVSAKDTPKSVKLYKSGLAKSRRKKKKKKGLFKPGAEIDYAQFGIKMKISKPRRGQRADVNIYAGEAGVSDEKGGFRTQHTKNSAGENNRRHGTHVAIRGQCRAETRFQGFGGSSEQKDWPTGGV